MKKTLIIAIVVFLGVTYWPLSLLREVKTFDKKFPGLREALETLTPEQQKELVEQMETGRRNIIQLIE